MLSATPTVTPVPSLRLLPRHELEDLAPTAPIGLVAMLEHGLPEMVVDVGYLATLISPDVWAHAALMDVIYGPYTATDWTVWVGGVVQVIRRHNPRPLHVPPAPSAVRFRAGVIPAGRYL
ncbi:hypothetical protein [Nonomuraea glycinis]|uniref:hypothetical protein n=1 Tax=Nonomuraea glycinis TaxID=2047744 RepID=UPI0033A9C6A7